MLPVSAAYRTDMAKLQRNRSYMRVLLQIFNLAAEAEAEASSNGEMDFSSLSFVGGEHTAPVNYATLEPRRFVLDGSQTPVPDEAPYPYGGFISEAMSDSSGAWASPPTVTLEFSEDYGFSGLTFTFDPFLGEYPASMRVTFSRVDGGLVYQGVVYPNAPVWEFKTKIGGAGKIVLEFLTSSRPQRRARLADLRLGVERQFDNARISTSRMVQDVVPLAGLDPTETFTVSILDYQQEYDPDNPNSFWEYIDAMTPMSLQYGYQLDSGEIEWLPDIRHHLDGKPTVEDWTIQFSANRQLGVLTGQYRKGAFATKTLMELAVDVLTDALGTPLPGETLWELDPILSTISTNAPLPNDTHQNCLQMIANAGMCSLYTRSDGVICMKTGWLPEGSAVGSMDFNTQFSRPSLEKIPPLYAVDVLMYQYETEATASELLNMSVVVDGTMPLQLNFSSMAKNVQISVEGATVESQSIYAQGADIVLSGNGAATISVTGNPVRESTSSAPYVVNPTISGETETVENKLVTSEAHRKALAAYRAEYLSLRSAYTMEYRGNPEYEVGDHFLIQTSFAYGAMALMLRNSIEFNGALRGEAILKRLTTLTSSYYTGEIYAGDQIGVM